MVCTGISEWESIVLLHLTSYAQFTRSSIKTSMRARLFLWKVAFALYGFMLIENDAIQVSVSMAVAGG